MTDSSVPASKQERLWTSLTSGRDFKVRIDGDYIYTEWVNIPPALQSGGTYMRQELKKAGDRWVGKAYWFFPYNYRGSVKWCRTDTELEINRLSDSRIEGQAQGWGAYDVKNCRPEKVESKPFIWIPK